MTTEINYKQYIKTSQATYQEDGERYVNMTKQDLSKPPASLSFPITREPTNVDLIDGIKFLNKNKERQRVLITEGHMCHYILYLERSNKLYKLCEIDTTYLDKFPKGYFDL